jgi:histidyl-tRNA synthetase
MIGGTMAPRTYAGTNDYFGDDCLKRQYIERTLRSVFRLFGFEPLETPVIELRETLMGKTEGETGSQIFKWRQGGYQGGEDIGLRFDHTVPLARVMAQYAGAITPNLPYKRYAMGPVFRAEKPQAGRLRQFTQMDIDTVGTSSMLADAEVIALCVYALRQLGFKDFAVEVNNRKILNGLAASIGLFGEDAVSFMRGLDKLGKKTLPEIGEEFVESLGEEQAKKAIRLTEKLISVKGTNQAMLRAVEKLAKETAEGVSETARIFDSLSAMGIEISKVEFNVLLARGLDYYTGPVFEMKVKEGGVGSLGGGGRYDKLIEALGGPSIPATGVSFGMERLTYVLTQLDLFPKMLGKADVFVTVFDPMSASSVAYASEIVGALRQEDIDVEMYVGEERLKAQLAVANRKGVKYAIIAGPDEEKRKTVTVKNLSVGLSSGEKKNKQANQVEIPFGELVNYIQ